MKIENINEWIYYYHIKDEEALPTLIEHFKPMVNSLFKLMCSSNSFLYLMQDECMSIADMTLVECLNQFRLNSKSSFYTYYYMCLKRNFIDTIRRSLHSSFPLNISTINFDIPIAYGTKTMYRDVIYDTSSLLEEEKIIQKCYIDFVLEKARHELSKMDYDILMLRNEGYSVMNICEKYGVSKQFIYYRLKKIRNWLASH